MPTYRILLAMLAFILAGCTPDQEHDSDAVLLGVFRRERPVFDQLVRMIEEDKGLERVDYDWTMPDPSPVSEARLAKYRELLRKVGCVRGFENFTGKDEVLFIASANGMATGGSSKGYCYTRKTPSPLVKDLDEYRPGHTRTYAAFRHIEGDWYLIYEYDD